MFEVGGNTCNNAFQLAPMSRCMLKKKMFPVLRGLRVCVTEINAINSVLVSSLHFDLLNVPNTHDHALTVAFIKTSTKTDTVNTLTLTSIYCNR